jgi:hypothetical protein
VLSAVIMSCWSTADLLSLAIMKFRLLYRMFALVYGVILIVEAF